MKTSPHIAKGSRFLTDRNVLTAYSIGAAMVFLIAVAGAIVLQVRDYQSKLHVAGQNNLLLASALAEQNTQVFARLNALARAVTEDAANPIVLSDVMQRRTSAEPAARSISVIDKSGRVIATNNVQYRVGEDLLHLPAINRLKEDATRRSYIGQANRLPQHAHDRFGGWVMNYVHRSYDNNGADFGFVLIEVDLTVLYGSYNNIVEGTGAVIGLIGEDGVIRMASGAEAVGQDVSSLIAGDIATDGGVSIRNNIRTGEEQIFGFSWSASTPMLSYVGTPVSDVFKAWILPATIANLALTALCAALVTVGLILSKYIRSRDQLLQSTVEAETERREREFLEAVLHTGGALVAVTDAAGRPIVTNPAFRKIIPADCEQGSDCFQCKQESDCLLQKVIGKTLPDIVATVPFETTLTVHNNNGKKRELAWTVTAIRSSNGGIKNLVAIGFDNTERREAELAIYQSSKLITLGEMATGLAHEINQPLGTITLTLDHLRTRLARGKADQEFIRDHVDLMSEQAERAAAVVNHLRIFGRRSDGKPRPIDPASAVEGTLTVVGRKIENAGITLIRKFNGSFQMMADQTAVEQILINLLINAHDAILEKRNKEQGTRNKEQDEGTLDRIELKIERREKQKQIAITVSDTGGGIPSHIIGRIFEPFFTTKPPGEGTGLGLALSYGMAKGFGGELSAKNTSTGARFTLVFPEAKTVPELQITADLSHDSAIR